ncbi:hypothetical protein BDL97_08G068500 [Sphagnum fallax]|nr:hypothetical protein BDL97_08G068500 [Sphagnum fallax]
MAFVAGLEAHLRMISTEAKCKYPIVKDAAERAMFKVRLLSSTRDVAGCDDILKTYLLACELKNTKLSILGLVGMEKLIAHDVVLPSALPSILATLKEDQMLIILRLCLRLLGNSRNPDSVLSTVVTTLRQGISLIFNRVLSAKDLPIKMLYGGTSSWASSFRLVAGEVSHSISASNLAEIFGAETGLAAQARNESLSEAGRLGVQLFEDLTSLAGGGRCSGSFINGELFWTLLVLVCHFYHFSQATGSSGQ